MFLRWANGSVCDLELETCQWPAEMKTQLRAGRILYEVKDSNPIAYGRQQTCAIGREEKIASAVDRAQQVGEL